MEANRMEHPEVLKWLIIGIFSFAIVLVFALGAKFKWFSSLSVGKGGLDIKAKDEPKKEIEKNFQSGNLNHLMDCEIHKLDNELIDFALEKSKTLRRAMTIELNKTINCHSTRRALASCLRYPLYEVSRKNDFKEKLRPENIKEYTDYLIKEIVYEYHDFAIEREMAWCHVNKNIKCPELPPLDDLLSVIRSQLIDDWALPIRNQSIDVCRKKIEKYNTYIPAFEELGDQVRIKICLVCIDKNKTYIKNLSKKPDKEAGEF
jgi:hypothetical protein